MLASSHTGSFLSQAHDCALTAANHAKVEIRNESSMERCRDIAALLIKVWGTSAHGAPIPADLLRSIGHAGCNVTAAYKEDGSLCGAAVGIVSPENSSMYSLIAGVLNSDSGVGFALKQHQRAWALDRGLTKMVWTFDPLVSRNARFNLTKLGAKSDEYVENFYGLMEDEINANDESDRLVAVWDLVTPETVACSQGHPEPMEQPIFAAENIRGSGPDGEPALMEYSDSLWGRVPTDIVGMRQENPDLAAAWRKYVREILTTAFNSGKSACGVTRTGWYKLAVQGEQ